MDLAEHADRLAIHHDRGLAPRHETRVVRLGDLVLVVEVVKKAGPLARRVVKVRVALGREEAESLPRARAGDLSIRSVGDLSDLEDTVRIDGVAGRRFRGEKTRQD